MTMKEEVLEFIEMKIRGKNMFWTKKIRFNNPQEHEASNIIQELDKGCSGKRILEFEYLIV